MMAVLYRDHVSSHFNEYGHTILSSLMTMFIAVDGTIKIWDSKGWCLTKSLEGYGGYVWSVAISTDGVVIVSGTRKLLCVT